MTRPTTGAGRLARYGLTDVAAAGVLLGPDGLNLWSSQSQAPLDDGAAEVMAALSDSADPDLALRQLQRMVSAGDPDVLDALRDDVSLRHRLISVLGASLSLGDDLVGHPDRWRTLTGAGTEQPEDLRSTYRAALLRIAAADLAGETDLGTTMVALAQLADDTLATALRLAEAERGATPRLAVIAMGKCGGRELNYVSDVDVIFVCAGDDDLADAQVIAARMMQICGQAAWTVDANLRPEGSQGPLVRTLAAHSAYYHRWARTWEFQALLKARPAAGDRELGQRWLDELQPLIWSAAERAEAVDDVRAMRRRIIDSVPPRSATGRSSAGRVGCATSSSPSSCSSWSTAAATRSSAPDPHWTDCAPWLSGAMSGGPTARRWLTRTASSVRSSTACSSSACAAPTLCPTAGPRPGRPRCAGSPRRLASGATPGPTRSTCSGRPGSSTPRRYAGCTPSWSTAHWSRRWPGYPARCCGSLQRRPRSGWRSSASTTRPARCATSRR